MEIRQRVVRETADADRTLIETLLARRRHLLSVLSESRDTMRDFSVLAAQSRAVNVVTDDVIHVRCAGKRGGVTSSCHRCVASHRLHVSQLNRN